MLMDWEPNVITAMNGNNVLQSVVCENGSAQRVITLQLNFWAGELYTQVLLQNRTSLEPLNPTNSWGFELTAITGTPGAWDVNFLFNGGTAWSSQLFSNIDLNEQKGQAEQEHQQKGQAI